MKQVIFRAQPWPDDDLAVVALRYSSPDDCWRVEVYSNDLDGDLGNMTKDQAYLLGHALIDASRLTHRDGWNNHDRHH